MIAERFAGVLFIIIIKIKLVLSLKYFKKSLEMEVIVANVDHIKFDIDYALEQQYGALPLPFPGMDSKIP